MFLRLSVSAVGLVAGAAGAVAGSFLLVRTTVRAWRFSGPLLVALRLAAVVTVLLLILAPSVTYRRTDKTKPFVAVLVDPFADRVALEARHDVLRPVAPIGIDAAKVVVHADQDVGAIGRDDEFQRNERHHHMRHAGGTARGGWEIA